MATITYTNQYTVLVVDDTVIEVFRRLVEGSLRIPLIWAGATLKPKKGGEVQVEIGIASNATDPFYSDSVITYGGFIFSVPQSEEPNLRSVLDEAARRGQRSATG